MPAEHAFPETEVHYTWDVGNRTRPDGTERGHGDPRDAGRERQPDQPGSTSKDIETIDWDRVYPLAGPIAVEGASPATRSPSRSSSCALKEWGWTAIIPGFGLLPDDFP